MTIDRSVLTGESLPDEASAAPDAEQTALADRRSIAYAGTSVVLGRGEGIVVATGPSSELGRIAGVLGPVDRGRSPLQRELSRLVRILLVVSICLVAVTVSFNLSTRCVARRRGPRRDLRGDRRHSRGPPILLAVILGLGAYRLLRRGVLVRRLNAQETLGAVDLIVTDKTGTLTENRLALETIFTLAGPVEDPGRRQELIQEGLRAEEDAWRSEEGIRLGSFTRALGVAMGEADVAPLDPTDLLEAWPPRDGQPYSMTRARRDGVTEELRLARPRLSSP